MAVTGVAEDLIENQLGCGCFQALVFILLFWMTVLPLNWSLMFMTFGSYNPGWRCLDQDDHDNNSSMISSLSSKSNMAESSLHNNQSEFRTDLTCDQFDACRAVQFRPDTSTVITEWGLLCDNAWIPSFIISIQMLGILTGSLAAGQLADSIGRKKTIYGSLFFLSALNAVSYFSQSWQTFTACGFFNGLMCACLVALFYTYPSEFFPGKWRGPLASLPAWNVAGILYGLVTMVLRDWRLFVVATSIVSFLCFLPVFWVPESLRWLEVKNKYEEFRSAAEKIAWVNRTTLKDINPDDFVNQKSRIQLKRGEKRYTLLSIFKPGYRLYSLIIGTHFCTHSIIFLSISFGLRLLGGNFFINLILINLSPILFSPLPVLGSNLLGRKSMLCAGFMLITVSLTVATCLELFAAGDGKVTGIIVCMMGVVVGTEACLCMLYVLMAEIYPTVIRGLGTSWGNITCRIGAIIAPFLIPKSDSEVYVWYISMACLGLFCFIIGLFLPETKGKPLRETFHDIEITVVLNESPETDC